MTTPQIAQGLASLGRNGDSVLVHMQPEEVAGLQSIAKANGTSLTINPDTGMPEAFSLGGFFKNLLPTIVGFGAAGLSGGAMSPMLAGILAGSATGALTNKKDPLMGAVMGGMGGYGGAGLQSAASSLVTNPVQQAVSQAGGTMSEAMLNPTVAQQIGGANLYSTPALSPASITGSTGQIGANMGATISPISPTATAMPSMAPTYGANNQMVGALSRTADTGIASALPKNGLEQSLSNIASNPMEFISQNKLGVGMPLGMAALSGMEGPTPGMTQEEYEAEQRRKFNQPLNLNQDTGLRLAAGGAIQTGGVMDLYQGTDSQPTFGGNQGYGLGRLNNLAQQQSMTNAEQGRFAKGGVPKLEDGGFVVPADVTFYLGNHDTEAGQQRLAQMYGGQPIKGPGTGLSDSIPTSIEGKEPARVANGEVYIPRKAVMAHGGPEKFYKMMDKVRKQATGSTKQAKSA